MFTLVLCPDSDRFHAANPLPCSNTLHHQMDTPELGNNIEDYMQSVGRSDEVTKGIAPGITPEIMEKYDISLGKDGVLNLSPKVPKAE